MRRIARRRFVGLADIASWQILILYLFYLFNIVRLLESHIRFDGPMGQPNFRRMT